MESRWFESERVRLHGMVAGPANGPLIILLHGFPEFWYGWRKQIPALAAAGFCVVALDQRGYNLSNKPRNILEYSAEHMASDVMEVADEMGKETFYVAGHDWGGVVAWCIGALRPDRAQRIAILNVPHPKIFRQHAHAHLSQKKKSAYMGLFRFPFFASMMLSAFNYAPLKRSMRRSSRPGTFTQQDFSEYQKAWSQPYALECMLKWYAAALKSPDHEWLQRRISPPTLILWGKQDSFIDFATAEQSLALCDNGRLRSFDDATHWLQHEESSEVNNELVQFFSTQEEASSNSAS